MAATPDAGAPPEKFPDAGNKKSGTGNGGENFVDKATRVLNNAQKVAPALLDKMEDAALDGMNKNTFLDRLSSLESANAIDKFSRKKLIFKAESLALQNPDKVTEARSKYDRVIATAKKMKAEKMPHKDIYNYFLLFHGQYDKNSSMVTNLLCDGNGNCEARAKLMVMLVEDVFGDEVQAMVETTNIKDSVTGKIVSHVRTIVSDAGQNYVLELPEARTVSSARFKQIRTFPPSIFTRAYLVNVGRDTYAKSESASAQYGVSSDTVFSLPHSKTIETKKQQQANLFGQKQSEKEEDGALHVDHLHVLDNPYVAQAIMEMAWKKSEYRDRSGELGHNQMKLYLNNLKRITPECVQILARRDVYVELHIGEGSSGLDKESVKALAPFTGALWVKLDCDMDQEVATVLSNKAFLHVYARGKIAPEAFNVFEKAQFGNGLSIRSHEKFRVEDVKKIVEQKSYLYHIDLDSDAGIDVPLLNYFLHLPANPAHRVALYNVAVIANKNLLGALLNSGTHNLRIQTSSGEVMQVYSDFPGGGIYLKIKKLTMPIVEQISGVRNCHTLEIETTVPVDPRVYERLLQRPGLDSDGDLIINNKKLNYNDWGNKEGIPPYWTRDVDVKETVWFCEILVNGKWEPFQRISPSTHRNEIFIDGQWEQTSFGEPYLTRLKSNLKKLLIPGTP